MRRTALAIPDVILLEGERHTDERGFLAETYNAETLRAAGITTPFVQDNFTLSPEEGTVRGLHFQAPPYAQAKLVRVVRGGAFTVAVDLRRQRPTFGHNVAVRLTAQDWRQLYIPRGFAHGVLTLQPDTEILMKLDAAFAPDHAHGLLWDDPDLGIPWPVLGREPIVSDRDRRQPRFHDLPVHFP